MNFPGMMWRTRSRSERRNERRDANHSGIGESLDLADTPDILLAVMG